MINYEKSAEMNNMTIEELKVRFKEFPSSNKKVWRVCDSCGNGASVAYNQCSNLCNECSHKSKKFRKRMSDVTTKSWSSGKRKGSRKND